MSSQKESAARQANIQYITGLASLLYLRGLNHADHFILAAKLGEIGAFGDSVFLYRENQRVTACFFHVLQSSKEETIPNVSDHLLYYFISFRKILRGIPWLEEQVGEQIQDVEIICFTDAKLSAAASNSNADHIADGGGLVCGPSILPKAWELFEEINKFWEFLLDMAEDIAEGVSDSILMDTAEIFQSLIASEELYRRVEDLKKDLTESGVDKLLSEIGGAVDKTHFRVFLEKFKVLHSQPDEVKLMELVKDEFIKLGSANNDIGILVEEEHFLKKLDKLFGNFKKDIFEWVENGDSWLTIYSPIWTNIVNEVVRWINESVFQTIEPCEVQFMEDTLESVSELILENSVVCINCQSHSTVLNLLKVKNVLEGLLYYFMNINTITKYLSLVVKSIERFWCSVLVIDVSGAQISELSIILGEIIRALSFNHDARLILVCPNSNEVLTSCLKILEVRCENYNDVISWASFSTRCQVNILKKPVNFQGINTALGDLLGPYSEIFNEFQEDILYSILISKDLVIGSDLPAVPDYFSRTFSRCVSCNMTILRSKIPNTLYALRGETLPKILEAIPEGENYHIYDPQNDTMDTFDGIQIIIMENENFENQFLKIVTDGKANVHCFTLSNEKLTWKWSVGDMSSLDQFILKEKPDHFHINKASDSPEELTIITGDEDVGKTTFLRHIARTTKKSDPLLWIVCLNLPDHESFLNNTLFDDPENLLPMVCEQATYPCDNVLSDILFLYYWKKGNIAIFIDGFEGVSWNLTGKIVDMIKLLRKNTKHVFVSCDSKIKNSLCENLSTFPFSLLPIGVDDQRHFLLKKWNNVVQENSQLSMFVDAVLELLRASVGEKDKKLCCLPLLTAIVARAFEAELIHFAKSGKINVPKKLNLISFYEIYVDKCCSEFLMKRTEANSLTQALLIENKLKLLDRYMILAVILMLPKDDLKQINVISTQYQNNKDFKRLKKTVGEGSLITLVNDHPVFVHRTLPEYFLAAWMVDVFATAKDFIEERFLESRYSTVRQWFDRLLCHNKELHWAVLNDDEEQVGAVLAAGVDVNGLDYGGRTALHLAASHDRPHMVGLLLTAGANVSAVDNVLGWRPLRYADRLRAWGALDRLLPAVGKVERADLQATHGLLENPALFRTTLLRVCEQGYVHLLDYFHSLNVDIKMVIDFEGSTSLHIAAENGRSEMVQYLLLLEVKNDCMDSVLGKFLSLIRSNNNEVEKKPDVNIRRNDGSSAVILAAQEGHHETLQMLFKFGASPNIKKLNGSTALHMAVAENHIEAARVLLEAGAEPDREDGEGITPLTAAATEGNSGLVRLLLELGASPNTMDNSGATPLHWAAAGGHLRSAEALVRAGANVNAKDGSLCTPLHWASLEGQSTLVRFLMGKGADAKIVNRAGGTAIHLAARENRPGTIRTFKNAGVDMNIANLDGSTPLHWACNKGQSPAVMCLLELGADLNVANFDGYTGLHLAALRGYTALVRKLLHAGAQPDGGENDLRAPPLHLASKGEHSECVSALLVAGATVNSRDPVGATALHWAAWCGHEVTVGMLLKAGADIKLVDNQGSTALHWAAGEGHAKVVTALITAGADPDVINRDGDAPLHWAASEGHAEAVTALLEGKANPQICDAEGRKPIRLAENVPHTEIVNLLTEATRSAPTVVSQEDTPVTATSTATEREKYEAEGNRSDVTNGKENSFASLDEGSVKTGEDFNKGRTRLSQAKPKDVERCEKEESKDNLGDGNVAEGHEKNEGISPHTSSLFQKSLFDFGDDDKSEFNLIRLSLGASDNNHEYSSQTGENSTVYQSTNSSHFQSSGGPVQRQISKNQFNEKVTDIEQYYTDTEEDSSSSDESSVEEIDSNDEHKIFDSKSIQNEKLLQGKLTSRIQQLNDAKPQPVSRTHVEDALGEEESGEQEEGRSISNMNNKITHLAKSRNIEQLNGASPKSRSRIRSKDYEENEREGEEIYEEKGRGENDSTIHSISPNSPPHTGSNSGSVFGSIYDAGSNIMRYARMAIWKEPSETTGHDRNNQTVSFQSPAETVDITKSNTDPAKGNVVPNGLTDAASTNNAVKHLSDSQQMTDHSTSATSSSWRRVDSSEEEELVIVSGSYFPMNSQLTRKESAPSPFQLENSVGFPKKEVKRKESKSSGVKFGLTELYDSDSC